MIYRVWQISALTAEQEARAVALARRTDREMGVASLTRETDRRRHEAGWLLLSTLAGEWLGVSPETLHWVRGAHGKPQCLSGPVQGNVSHAGDWVLCGVSARPIGVDIETRRPVSPALIHKICQPAEKAYVTAPDGDSTDRFLQLWTAKEAYVKYTGEGLSRPLNSVAVATETGLSDRVEGISLYSLRTEHYWAALVSEEPPKNGNRNAGT